MGEFCFQFHNMRAVDGAFAICMDHITTRNRPVFVLIIGDFIGAQGATGLFQHDIASRKQAGISLIDDNIISFKGNRLVIC